MQELLSPESQYATKDPQPDVVPVGFDFDGNYFYVGGMNLLKSTKYRNVLKNNKVPLVIDDLKSIDPCDPRGMKIYGTADIVGTDYQEFYKILSLLKDIFPWVFMSQELRSLRLFLKDQLYVYK